MAQQEVLSNGDSPATPKQLDLLKQLKVEIPEGLTKRVASELITVTLEAKNGKVKQSFEGVKITEKPNGISNGDTPAVKIGMIEKMVLTHFSRRNEALPTANEFVRQCNYMLALCNAWEDSLK